MSVRTSSKWVVGAALLAYFASSSPADAQPSGAAGTGASTEDPAAQVRFQRKTQLSTQEQVGESAKHIARMEQAGGGVRRMLEEARKARDVVKTLCLNDKLSQVDVAIRSAKDRRQALQAAVTRSDSELANHEFTILTVLRQRVEQLVAEANQCIGEEAAFVGDSKVITTVDPAIPADEAPPAPTEVIVMPPQCTSCSL